MAFHVGEEEATEEEATEEEATEAEAAEAEAVISWAGILRAAHDMTVARNTA